MIDHEIYSSLPQNYGTVLYNFDEKPRIKYGLVVPTFGRPEYVLDCFSSLQKSVLKETIICIIDETTSEKSYPLENFYEFKNIDSPGYDIKNIPKNIQEITKEGKKETRCIAFNSSGWLKYRICPLSKIEKWKNTNVKLYVKKDYLDNHKELYNKLRELESDAAQHKPNSKTEEIVRSFIIPDVPIIKIFKKYHGNMYDSLKQGWDLLFKVFQCTYLVSLDSDTLVKQNWLDELHNTFKIANKKNRIV